ncbi:MAG: carbohydrate binding family 9 domain-containing protein [Acidimicrobiia bacterium]|nr:carbohydrate binding family 9 domain-containing protein [Acidimicrobiia bacterium]
MKIPRLGGAPSFDELHASAQRGELAEATGFRQRVPGDGAPVSAATSAYLAHDGRNLHVLFVCREDPAQVRANLSKREEIGNDDFVAIYLDTFHDRQRAYVFAANPLGIQRDAVITEGQPEDSSFDTLWNSHGRLTADGFLVWMSIPFRSLRFSHAPAQRWGFALRRQILRTNEETYYPHISNRVQGFVQQFATLEGLDGVSPGRNIQLIPYGAFTHARLQDAAQPAFTRRNDARAGLDSKFVIRDALSFDVTVNPDFSQVESDDPQVTVNQRFEVFFPEKRPFFLENAGYFETPLNLFFSRRIVDPQVGARLTGKIGRWAVAGLAANDRAPGEVLESTNPLYPSNAEAGLVRVQREFGQQSRVAVFASTRQFGPQANHVVSADSRLKLNDTWFFTGQAAWTTARDSRRKSESGSGYLAQILRAGRGLTYQSRYLDLSPQFRADLGFVRRVDIRTTDHFLGYRWWRENGPLQNFGPGFTALINYDHSGRLQDWIVDSAFSMNFTGQTEFNVNHGEQYEFFQTGFRKHRSSASLFTGWLRWLSLFASYGAGTQTNFNPAIGLRPFLADSADGSFTMTLRPTARFRWDQTYLYARLDTPRADIFTNHLVRSRVNYQFNKELSLRFIADYSSIRTNPELIAQEDFRRVSGDVLLTYQLNAHTALFLGCIDREDNVRLLTGPRPQDFTNTGRQVFVKLSYLLRF